MKFRPLLAGVSVILTTVGHLAAQTVAWLPAGPNDLFSNGANWVGGSPPPTNASGVPRFQYADFETVSLPTGSLSFGALQFEALSDGFSEYRFTTPGSTGLSLQGAGISKYGSAPTEYVQATFGPGISISLAADQTWTLNYMLVSGPISGAGRLTFQPTTDEADSFYGLANRRGTLELRGAGNFSGGFEAQQAQVILGHGAALAGTTASIRLANSDLMAGIASNIGAPVTFHGDVGFFSVPNTSFGFTLAGPMTLDGDVRLFGGAPLTLSGKIAESVATPGAILTTEGKLVISGDNSTGAYTGGTIVSPESIVIFTSANAVPATGLISASNTGYVGAAFSTNVQTALVNRLNASSFLGTLGFDSPNPAAPLDFTEPLNLSGLANFRGLGSTSAATLSGAITLGAGQDYRFGGGSGRLTISSALNQTSAGLILDSPAMNGAPPLTVILRGANTYGDGTEIRRGALIFDGASALPATGGISFNQDDEIGYAGFTEATGLTFAQFMARVDSLTLTGAETTNIIGLDSTNPALPRTISGTLDLSLGGTLATSYYLGSATKAIVSGPILPAGSELRLAGVNGGHLVVNSSLGSSIPSVRIGIEDMPGTVELNAPSSIAGVVAVMGGTLLVGHENALGTAPVSFGEANLAATKDLTLKNTFVGFSDGGLTIGRPGSPVNLTLAGTTAAALMTYQGGGQLKLTRVYAIGSLVVNATGSGGVLISSSATFDGFDFDYDNYYDYYPGFGGLGMIPVTATLNSGYLAFSMPNAALEHLEGNSGTQLIVHGGTNLSLFNDSEAGIFGGVISGGGSLTLLGESLTLAGNNSYSGGTVLSGGGTLAVAHNNALGTGPLHVTGFGGGLSALVGGLTLPNNIALDVLHEDAAFDGGLGILGDLQLTLAGTISGPGGILKRDDGTLRLTGNNTFSGGMLLEGGTIEFAHDRASGTGPLIFDPETSNSTKAVFTTSAPVLHGLANHSSAAAVVELAANSNLTITQNLYSEFFGSINGVGGNNARLTKSGFGGLLLEGTNTYSGGTFVTGGGIIFAGTSAIPTAGSFVLSANGYVGFGGANTPTDIANFLGKFDPGNTLGTIGFDTNNPSLPYQVTTPLDLKSYNFDFRARLGSASHAVISSTITPQGAAYRFGGGGGLLQVSSALTDQTGPAVTRRVEVESPATTPLTLRLTSNASTYTGGLIVTQSALIFGAGVIPPSGTYTLNSGGYIGWEDPSINANTTLMGAYVARFGVTNGIIGFDIAPGALPGRTITSNIDLSNAGNAYLGTTSGEGATAGVRLVGTITPSGNTYRFTGYKGGSLEVVSTLSGARSVAIGDPAVFATLVDPNRSVLDIEEPVYSTVILSGANTHTGDTFLHGGMLLLGNAGALGAAGNTLRVDSVDVPAGFAGEGLWRSQLGTMANNFVVGHNILLNSDLGLNGAHDFSLTGTISGSGGLFAYDGTFRLGGANTFSGGLNVTDAMVFLDHAQAAGSGVLSFGEDGEAYFGVSAAIGGLSSDTYYSYLGLEDGVSLTINQNTDTTFRGEVYSASGVGARLVKTGTGTLRMEGYGTFLDGLDTAGTRISMDIQQGTVVAAGPDQPLGVDAVRLSGGTLALDHALLENNLITVSGRVAGIGTIAGSASVGTNVTIAPGLSGSLGDTPVGRLSFATLALTGGGTLEWNVQSVAGGGIVTDSVGVFSVNGLAITSLANNPFTVKVVSLLPDGSLGALAGLAFGETYSWVLFETNGVTGFDPSKFTIDASQFNSGIGPGTFSLSLSTTPSLLFTQSLMLNFTPVPEPSTWAMLLAGVAAVAFTVRRRRKQGFRPARLLADGRDR